MPKQMLTTAQYDRLERFPDDVKVVGTDRGCPLVRHKGGRIVRVLENGRTVPATKDSAERIERRLAA